MSKSPKKSPRKWHLPSEVMKLQKLKLRKKALQARIAGSSLNKTLPTPGATRNASFDDIFSGKKRKNPFVKAGDDENKRLKPKEPIIDESTTTDQTLFKLLHTTSVSQPSPLTSFENILGHRDEVMVVKAQGESHAPIDWGLKTKMRLWSEHPFMWNTKLKIGEEASGTTGFVRCLDTSAKANLDTSPNSKFYQCCQFWQQPSLPWLSLFPRSGGRVTSSEASFANTQAIKTSLMVAYSDSLRSLFQLMRMKQCPYFYLCSNSFTVLFRAAGFCGMSEMHALITPTTRGFRQILRQEDIDFTMPLKKRLSDQGYETLDSVQEPEDEEDETWLKSMGVNAEDIKQINYTQARIVHRAECEVDNSEQSLVLVEGVEVHSLYNFLLNCKSATSITGPLAGVPPTLLSPVAFAGATLTSLKVRESKAHVDDKVFYSLELTGPILPTTVHNLFAINPTDRSLSVTFSSLAHCVPLSKIVGKSEANVIFEKENLSDCGLDDKILKQFCNPSVKITSVECLKYNSECKTYTWT